MTQYWYLIVLLSAVFLTVSNLFKKKTLKYEHSEEFVVLYKTFQAVIVLFVLLPFIDFNISLWILLFIYGLSLVISLADFYIIKGYRHEDISVVSPLTNLTPLFLLIFAFVFLREKVSLMQLLGILLLISGTYILEVHKHLFDFKIYFKKLKRSKYVAYVLFAAFLYAIINIGKKYILNFITPLNAVAILAIFVAINFIILSVFRFNHNIIQLKTSLKKYGYFIVLGALFTVLSDISFFYALSFAFVSLVLPIKRISTLFDTIIGGELFKEKYILHKAFACLIMLIGVYLIVI